MPSITQRTLTLFLLALCTLADSSNFLNLATSPIHSPEDGALNANLLESSWTTDQGNNDPLQAVTNQQANPDFFIANQSDKCKGHQAQTRRRRQLRLKRAPDTFCPVDASGGMRSTTEAGQQTTPNTNEVSKEKPATEQNGAAVVPGESAGIPNSGICGDERVHIPLCFLSTPDEKKRILTVLLTPCRARE